MTDTETKSLFRPLAPLRRPALEALVEAYREEFITAYFHISSPERADALQALDDFESRVLRGPLY